MDFLRFLEGIRTPVATAIFSFLTYFGDELFFMVLAITVFWCVSKRYGYYILAVGFLGTVLNQFMKLWFRVPRPWVLDPDFTIVESAGRRPAVTPSPRAIRRTSSAPWRASFSPRSGAPSGSPQSRL